MATPEVPMKPAPSKPREAASAQEEAQLLVDSDDEDFVVRIPRRNCGAGIPCVCSSVVFLLVGLLIGMNVNVNTRKENYQDGFAMGGDGYVAPDVVYSASKAVAAPAPGSPPATPCTLRDVSWLHIPRNGLSFALVIIGCGCPTLPQDQYPEHKAGIMNMAAWSWKHQPQFCPQLGSQLLGRQAPMRERPANTGLNYVGMFRDPRRRLVSAYSNHLDAWGFDRQEHEEMVSRVKTLLDFVTYEGIPGCQARMLLGMRCADTRNAELHPKQEMEALTRVDQMAFVGITDHWALSVKLFHATFGGAMSAEDLVNLKPSDNDDTEQMVKELSTTTDPSDWKVYTGAVQLFVDRVKTKLPEEPIPKELDEIASVPHPAYP